MQALHTTAQHVPPMAAATMSPLIDSFAGFLQYALRRSLCTLWHPILPPRSCACASIGTCRSLARVVAEMDGRRFRASLASADARHEFVAALGYVLHESRPVPTGLRLKRVAPSFEQER